MVEWLNKNGGSTSNNNKQRKRDGHDKGRGREDRRTKERQAMGREGNPVVDSRFPPFKVPFFWGNLPLFSTQHAVWLWHCDSPARSLEQPCFIRNMMKNQQDSGYGPMPHAISSWLVWLVTINHYSSHCIIANPHYRIKWLVDVGCISHYTPISQYSWIILYIYILCSNQL